MKIAALGGTGNLGPGLARRWAAAGHEVIIGSRTADKAQAAAAEIQSALGAGAGTVSGTDNVTAAAACEIAALTVPWAHQASTLETVRDALDGKILIDVTVPLIPPRVDVVQLPPEGSAAQAAQKVLGERVRVVSAFQNVAAHHLQAAAHEIDCDVLVSSDDEAAAEQVCALAEAAGMRAFYAGPLANAVIAEALTSALIGINRRHKCHSGVRITGVP